MINDKKGFEKMASGSCCSEVGAQGVGGSQLVGGAPVMATHNPRGISPKKIGGGLGGLVKDPVQPKVGK